MGKLTKMGGLIVTGSPAFWKNHTLQMGGRLIRLVLGIIKQKLAPSFNSPGLDLPHSRACE
jgi:hypothetical protein